MFIAVAVAAAVAVSTISSADTDLLDLVLLLVEVDDRLGLVVEGVQTFLDGFLVVVHPSAALAPLQETGGHRGVGDVKVQHTGAWRHLWFK